MVYERFVNERYKMQKKLAITALGGKNVTRVQENSSNVLFYFHLTKGHVTL